MAATQSLQVCGGSKEVEEFKLSVRRVKKGDRSDFEDGQQQLLVARSKLKPPRAKLCASAH